MTEFYRFRTIEQLLKKPFEELERQTIFFSTPEALNDPMEGLQDLVWDGDHIVWGNLFKHYAHCLTLTFLGVLIVGQNRILEPGDIPVEERQDSFPTPRMAELFKDVWQKVQSECELKALAGNIAGLEYSGLKHRVRRAELLIYFQLTQMQLLAAIQDVFIDYNLMPEPQRIPIKASKDTLLTIKGFFELLKQVPEINAASSKALFSAVEIVYRRHLLSHGFALQEVEKKNAIFLLSGYPSAYLEQLPKLLWPDWYAACFVKEYHNSSMWAHYAGGHRGTCLIFEASEAEDQATLDVKQITGWSSVNGNNGGEHWGLSPMPFHEVDYKSKPDEVDFFRSIGQVSEEALIKLWYTGDGGDLSRCAEQVFGPSADTSVWRRQHQDNFIRNARFKSKDWEYEKEFRLILDPDLGGSLSCRQRTLSYDFNSLKGIIFGIRMSDSYKLEAFNILTNLSSG